MSHIERNPKVIGVEIIFNKKLKCIVKDDKYNINFQYFIDRWIPGLHTQEKRRKQYIEYVLQAPRHIQHKKIEIDPEYL
jgi:hypothetical protein